MFVNFIVSQKGDLKMGSYKASKTAHKYIQALAILLLVGPGLLVAVQGNIVKAQYASYGDYAYNGFIVNTKFLWWQIGQGAVWINWTFDTADSGAFTNVMSVINSYSWGWDQASLLAYWSWYSNITLVGFAFYEIQDNFAGITYIGALVNFVYYLGNGHYQYYLGNLGSHTYQKYYEFTTTVPITVEIPIEVDD